MRHQLIWTAAAVFLAMVGTAQAGSGDRKFDVYWIDVEGGASTLLVSPQGESLLIDTGNPGRRDAQRIFEVAAKVAGLRKIDILLTTHYHLDHYGGAAVLSELMPIGQVIDNGQFEGGRERPEASYLEFRCEGRSVIQPGQKLPLKQAADPQSPRLSVTCLAARQKLLDVVQAPASDEQLCSQVAPKDRDLSDNANSIVLLVEFGPFRFFDGGDLTWNIEQQLVCPRNLVGTVDVYQVTHHGLDSSNNPVLVRSLEPKVAIMNNGVTKGCQPQTFHTLQEIKSIEAIYQMHRNERADGENNAPLEFIANREAMCQANHIHLAVAPDGRSYTISIPAHRHQKTYTTKAAAK